MDATKCKQRIRERHAAHSRRAAKASGERWWGRGGTMTLCIAGHDLTTLSHTEHRSLQRRWQKKSKQKSKTCPGQKKLKNWTHLPWPLQHGESRGCGFKPRSYKRDAKTLATHQLNVCRDLATLYWACAFRFTGSMRSFTLISHTPFRVSLLLFRGSCFAYLQNSGQPLHTCFVCFPSISGRCFAP